VIALGKRELGPHQKYNLAHASSRRFFSCEIHEMAEQIVSVKYNNIGEQEILLLLEKAYLVQQPDSLDLTYSIPLVTTPPKLQI